MTGEAIGYTIDLMLKNNVLDIYTTPIMMKKNRPAIMLTCLCTTDKEEQISRLLLKHTTTKGIRVTEHRRHTLDSFFHTVTTKFGDIKMKIYSGLDLYKYKPEYEDVLKASKTHNVPIQQVNTEVLSVFHNMDFPPMDTK